MCFQKYQDLENEDELSESTMTVSNSLVSSGPPALPPRPDRAISVQDGCIQIGQKRYQVQCGGQRLTDQASLEVVQKVLSYGMATKGASHITLSENTPGVDERFVSLLRSIQQGAKQMQQEELGQALLKALKAKGYTTQEVKSAVDAIFHEAHIALVDRAEGKTSRSQWGEKTIGDLLHEPGNSALRLALSTLPDEFKKASTVAASAPSEKLRRSERLKRCCKDVQLFVLENMQRNPKSVTLEDGSVTRQHIMKGNGGLAQFLDSGRVLSQEQISEENKGFPSERDKGLKRKGIEGCNTNLGAVVHHTPDGKADRVITMRSGKSDTLERLQELVATSCLQESTCSARRGFTKNSSGELEYQLVVSSYLDQSFLKALPEMIKGLFSHSENEADSFAQIVAAQKQWPKNGYEITVIIDGEEKKVILKKPIIHNQLLSSTVRGVSIKGLRLFRMGQNRADMANLAANHELFHLYIKTQPNCDLQGIKDQGVILNKRLQEALQTNDTFLDSDGFIDFSAVPPKELEKLRMWVDKYQFEVAKVLLFLKKDPTARSLFITLFRQYPTNVHAIRFPPNPKQEVHAADLAIYKNQLFNALCLTHSVQCKSGTDRTGLAIALAVAQDSFKQKYDRNFDPQSTNREELLYFKKQFRSALKELAVSMTVETKGYSGIKWGGGVPIVGGIGNPVAHKYLYIQGDVDSGQEDVSDLSYSDLARSGLHQYKGAIKDSRGLFGKSKKAHLNELKSLEKGVDPALFKEVVVHSENILRDCGITVKGPVFNERLQLKVHVGDLELNGKRIDTLQQHIQLLKKLEQPKYLFTLYALEQVVLLWQMQKEAALFDSVVLDEVK